MTVLSFRPGPTVLDSKMAERVKNVLILLTSFIALACGSYYERHKCFATGDCILSTAYFAGGYSDEYNRWITECNDGEAMIGIFDAVRMFIGVEQVWCKFVFPMKPPSRGIYPFYPQCNVRNQTMKEYYCYDKYWPTDTVDTFAVGVFGTTFQDPGVPTAMKCCKTPQGYHLDYSRCSWKYTHDKAGEHYDGYWLTKCETNEIMTGLGQAVSPTDGLNHFVWIQCCPVIYTGIPSAGSAYRLPLPPNNNYVQQSSYSSSNSYAQPQQQPYQ